MGRAVADAPNPLDAPPPASMSGTDDLLAQLAGDEIDRLLAEADVERPAAAPAAPAAAAAPAPTATPTADPASKASDGDELDNLLSELNKEPEAADAGPKQKTLTEQVPDVLAQLAVRPAVTVGESAAAAETTPVPTVEPEQPLDAVMSAQEREALSLSNLEAATAAAEQQDASMAAAEAKATGAAVAPQPAPVPTDIAVASGPVHPVVRVLEWINKPLSFIPDAARDPIGKAAIVTIVNSIAVLIYVVFIRH